MMATKKKKEANVPDLAAVLARVATASGMVVHFGVSRTRVYQWMDHPDFPAPLDAPHLQAKVWDLDAVQAWRERDK